MIEYTGHFEIKVTGRHSCKEILAFSNQRYNQLNEQVHAAKRAIKNKAKYCKRQQNILDIAKEIQGAPDYMILMELAGKYRHRFRSLSWRYSSWSRKHYDVDVSDRGLFSEAKKELSTAIHYDTSNAQNKIDIYTKRAEDAREQLPILEELLGEFKAAKDLNDLLFTDND